MKIVGFGVACLLSFFSVGQNSYYFSEPLPSATQKVGQVSSKFFGTYMVNTGTLEYTFDASGVTLVSTTIASMSRETIRESTKYDVRNGFIFGVVKDDSLPCVLQDEYYYFGVRNHDLFVGTGMSNILTKTDDPSTYVLNVFENGKYIPQLLHFKGGKLIISHFDYDGSSLDEFSYIKAQESLKINDLNLVTLSPTASEFDRMKAQAFVETMALKK